MNFDSIFKQEGNKLTINYLDYNINFNMPDYFNISDVSEDLKILSLMTLFYPIDETLINHKFTRKSSGNKIGLAFSGGVDSAAAYCLLPKDDTILFHHKRIISTKTLYKHENSMCVIENLPHEVLIIDSNLEDIRLKLGKMVGFLNDMSFYGGFVLLTDYLNIGYLSTGMMLESTYIKGGYEYRDFHNTTYYKKWFGLFNRANLPLFFPCIPCSEILTNKIVADNNVFSQSCIRGINGEGCNNCYKCFRKNLINGKLITYNPNSEINIFLSKRPLKQGASLIYAMNKGNFNILQLKEYKDLELEWLEKYFDHTLLSIPLEHREYLKNELNKYTESIDDESILKLFKL